MLVDDSTNAMMMGLVVVTYVNHMNAMEAIV